MSLIYSIIVDKLTMTIGTDPTRLEKIALLLRIKISFNIRELLEVNAVKCNSAFTFIAFIKRIRFFTSFIG